VLGQCEDCGVGNAAVVSVFLCRGGARESRGGALFEFRILSSHSPLDASALA